jgi:cell wall assembly regulator SMI1
MLPKDVRRVVKRRDGEEEGMPVILLLLILLETLVQLLLSIC